VLTAVFFCSCVPAVDESTIDEGDTASSATPLSQGDGDAAAASPSPAAEGATPLPAEASPTASTGESADVSPEPNMIPAAGTETPIDADASTPDPSSTPTAPPATDAPPPAIAGTWIDDYGTRHDIDAERWIATSGGVENRWTIDTYSNGGRYVIALGADSNQEGANLWSRFDWTDDGTNLWYCHTESAAPSAEAAEAEEPADPRSPATGGCQGFPWSRLTPWPS